MQLLVCGVIFGPALGAGCLVDVALKLDELFLCGRECGVVGESALEKHAVVDEPVHGLGVRAVDGDGIHQLRCAVFCDEGAPVASAPAHEHAVIGEALQRAPRGDLAHAERVGDLEVRGQLLARGQ